MDAHVLERARMTDSEFQFIQKELKDSLNAMRARSEDARSAADPRALKTLCPPHSNTGGLENKTIHLVLDNGEIKEVLPRKHYESKTAFIDWVNFTCHDSTFEFMTNAVTDGEIVLNISFACDSIFGFGITGKRDRGANFYHSSYTLGNNWGMVCYGGQRNTVLVTLSGEGCSAARHGWERRLYDFLNSAQNAKITRIDLAHDDINGEIFNMAMLERAYDEGGFKAGKTNPDIEMLGNWKNPNGKGRTLNIGNRTNGKFCRCYEKGCQLGSKLSTWVRCEVEFKGVDRIIPFDCLLYPHEFLAASYPIFANLSKVTQRIVTTKKTVELSYERTKNWLTKQCGSALNLINEIEGEHGIQELFRDGKLPKGVIYPSFLESPDAIHTYTNPHQPAIFQQSILE